MVREVGFAHGALCETLQVRESHQHCHPMWADPLAAREAGRVDAVCRDCRWTDASTRISTPKMAF